MKSALIIGGAGFTGIALTKELRKRDYIIYNVIRPNSPHKARLDNYDVHILECDLADLLSLKISRNIDTLFYLAWTAGKSFQGQFENICFLNNAVELASKIGCSRIIITGSQAEYGVIPPTTKQTEDMPCNPITAYGAAKLAACHLSRIRAQELNIEWIWARIFSLIGKYEPRGRMLPDLFSALKEGHDFHLSSGRQNWDYLDVHDAAEALIALAEKGHSNEIYNIANGNYKPLREYTEELKTLIGGTGQIYYGEDPNPFISLQPSVEKIFSHTAWGARRSFEESVKDYNF